MTHGSLFSGIGGFDLAAEWMGWDNVFHCEWMPFPRKVLEYHFPNADSHIDICSTDFTKYANKIDILTGGFPCQPFSTAGKRKGTNDERYLWGEMLRAIQEIKPKFVIGENVFGITNIDGGLVFEQVCLDLEAEGYEVQPFIIPACAKNAPHRRDRVWFVAYASGERHRGGNIKSRTNHAKEREMDTDIKQYRDGIRSEAQGCCSAATDTKRERFQRCATPEKILCEKKSVGVERNKFAMRSSAVHIESNWRNFPTQSPICGGDDGIPTELDGITFSKWRAESIKGYGNAIVPQVAFEIFKQIEKL